MDVDVQLYTYQFHDQDSNEQDVLLSLQLLSWQGMNQVYANILYKLKHKTIEAITYADAPFPPNEPPTRLT